MFEMHGEHSKSMLKMLKMLKHEHKQLRRRLVKEEKTRRSLMEHKHENIVGLPAVIADIVEEIKMLGKSNDKLAETADRATGFVRSHPEIERASRVYANIQMTIDLYRDITLIKNETAGLRKQVRFLSPEDTAAVLEIHARLRAFENTYLEIVEFCENMSNEQFIRIRRKFDKLFRLREDFTHFFFNTVGDIFVFAKEGSAIPECLADIVRMEESLDRFALSVKACEKSSQPRQKEFARENKRYLRYEPKGYKRMFNTVIVQAVKTLFSELDTTSFDAEQLRGVLDLLLVFKKNIAQCFKSVEENIVDVVVKTVHDSVYVYVNSTIRDMDDNDILCVLEWTKEYYDFLERTMKIAKDDIEPDILGRNAKILREKHVSITVSKLHSWMCVLKEKEIAEFCAREKTPYRDEHGILISCRLLDIVQILDLQIVPVTFDNKIFESIVDSTISELLVFKKNLVSAVHAEYRRLVNNEEKPGFEEYVIMYSNTSLAVAEALANISIGDSRNVKKVIAVFLELRDVMAGVLADLIVHTLRPVLAEIFRPRWYEMPVMETLYITLADFFDDYRGCMYDNTFAALVERVLEMISVRYFVRVFSKSAVFRKPEMFESTFGRDLEGIKDVFSSYLPEEKISRHLEPMRYFGKTVAAKMPETFRIALGRLIGNYPDVHYSFVREIIVKKGIDCDQLKAFARHKIASVNSSQHKTVFGKISKSMRGL